MSIKKFSYMDGLLITVAAIWGINTPVMKIGYKYIPPLAFSSVRLLFALIVAWMAVYFSKSYRRVEKKDYFKIAGISIIGFGLFQYCFTVGVNMVSAGNASLILSMVPIGVVVINKIFKIEEITIQSVIGIIFSIIGIIFIVMGSGKGISIAKDDLVGAVILLAAQFCFAYYMVFSKELFQRYSVYQITAYIVTVSAILFPLVYFKEVLAVDWASVALEGWLSSIYSGVVAMCIGNFLWSFGVKKVGSTRTAIYNNLSPVFAIAVGCIFLSESFGFMQFLGAAAIFAGLFVTRIKTKKTEANLIAEESIN